MEYPATTATAETLPNGLTIILDPDRSAPVVSAQWWVETGSIHEGHLLGSGVSHFLEHMLFKGTRDFSAEELATAVPAAGGHWNAYTTFGRTVYYIDGPSDSLPLFLKCLSGMVFYPTLPESEFDGEKDVIRREIDMGLDDPNDAATRLLFATAFRDDPRRHPVIGHRHLFDRISHEDLIGYHRARYTTDRSFLVVSGDFDPEAVRGLVVELTADCQPGGGQEPLVPLDPPQLGPRRARETFPLPHSRISLAWKIPPLDDPATPAFELLATILGQGRSSRLHRNLRDKRGLALEISAFAWNNPGREGLFGISADAETAQRDTLIEAIQSEITTLLADDLATELAKAQRMLAASQFRSLTTASGRASDLASNWHEARDLDFTRSHVAALHAVTVDDLKDAALRLTDRTLTVTVIDPPDTPAPARTLRSHSTGGEPVLHTLSNGIPVALHVDSRVPLIHLQAAARAGLPSETAACAGINQLLASSLPKGTATRTADEIATLLESLGASASAVPGNNALLVQCAGLSPDLAALSDVWSELISAPSFPEDAVNRERASQIAAWQESLTEPLHVAFRALREEAFGKEGYGLDPLGSGDSLESLDRTALAEHHVRHLHAGNLVLAVAGDMDPPAVIDALESGLGRLPKSSPWQPPASRFTAGRECRRELPKKQAVLCVGFPSACVTADDRHAMAMIQEYASDMAGPLFTRIREELGLAYQVGATQFHGYDTGLFTFFLATSPEQLATAREALMEEIGKIARQGIPEDALERVRSTVISGLAIDQQSPAKIARHMALNLLYGLPADDHRKLPSVFREIGANAVRAAAARFLGGDPVVATVAPA